MGERGKLVPLQRGLFDPVVANQGGLVLSLFPGIDLLGRAFRSQGFTVVEGPELLFGGDVREFRGIAGRFDGVIGGPPCQDFSRRRRVPPTGYGVAMLGEFLRVVAECNPVWFLLENVPGVPDVKIAGYAVQRFDLTDRECGGEQLRSRHFQFGHCDGFIIRPKRLQHMPRGKGAFAPAVLCRSEKRGEGYAVACRRQGLAEPIKLPFPTALKRKMVGNAVPLKMGLAVAEAVTRPGPVTVFDCLCLCGRMVIPPRTHALPSCRKRMERRRRAPRQVVTFPGA